MNKMILVFGMMLMANVSAHKIEQGFMVIDPDHSKLKIFANNPEIVIDHVSKSGYEVYGAKSLEQLLMNSGVFFTLMKPVSVKGVDYPTPEAIIKTMQNLQKKYPTLISLIEIGKSVQGRSLMVARITAPAKVGIPAPAARPEFKYVATLLSGLNPKI